MFKKLLNDLNFKNLNYKSGHRNYVNENGEWLDKTKITVAVKGVHHKGKNLGENYVIFATSQEKYGQYKGKSPIKKEYYANKKDQYFSIHPRKNKYELDMQHKNKIFVHADNKTKLEKKENEQMEALLVDVLKNDTNGICDLTNYKDKAGLQKILDGLEVIQEENSHICKIIKKDQDNE